MLKYTLEAKTKHVSGIHNNYWFRIHGPEGVIASFGKPVPANNSRVVRDNAELAAKAMLAKLNDAGETA